MSQVPQGNEGIFCYRCGYNLSGVAVGGQCPECGTPVASSYGTSVGPSSGKAIASMVLGIVSIPACVSWGIGSLVCGTLAVIFWHLAKQDLKRGGYSANSNGMAIAGLVCGLAGLVIGLAMLAYLALMLFGMWTMVGQMQQSIQQMPATQPAPPSPTGPSP